MTRFLDLRQDNLQFFIGAVYAFWQEEALTIFRVRRITEITSRTPFGKTLVTVGWKLTGRLTGETTHRLEKIKELGTRVFE